DEVRIQNVQADPQTKALVNQKGSSVVLFDFSKKKEEDWPLYIVQKANGGGGLAGSPEEIQLGHELIHADRISRGVMIGKDVVADNPNRFPYPANHPQPQEPK